MATKVRGGANIPRGVSNENTVAVDITVKFSMKTSGSTYEVCQMAHLKVRRDETQVAIYCPPDARVMVVTAPKHIHYTDNVSITPKHGTDIAYALDRLGTRQTASWARPRR